ncbi:MAG TPA: serine hydrolase [Longimicrobiales bacterium]|nr:serine hydrolase [Longimicrobiales bacterium]
MKLRHAAFLIAVALSAGCLARPEPPLPAATPAVDSAVWVDSLMRTLTLDQKVGQMLMTRMQGDFANLESAELRRAAEQIRELGVGGLAVGIGTPTEMAAKLNALQRVSALPLWFAADLEWGAAMRLWRPTFLPYGIEGGGGTAFPFNMGIGATGQPGLAEQAGRITGREARAVGVHWVLAPVADVNTSAENPIVNVRSYGSDPAQVAQFVASFVRGAQAARVLTAAKHFPGHGDTRTDSHIELPVLDVTRQRLDSIELKPFRAAITAGASGIMTGHLAVPAITGSRTLPATVSPQIGTLLRQELGFTGLIITDAMTMGALRTLPGYSPGEIAVRAVEAGADVVLGPPDAGQAHAAILAAVRANRITVARIDASVRRILAAKAWLGLHRDRFVAIDSVNRIVAAPEHEALAGSIAAQSITLVRDSAGVVPIDPRRARSLAVIAFSAVNDLNAGRALAAELGRVYDRVQLFRLDESLAEQYFDEAVSAAAAADAAVVATFLMPISGQGHINVPPRAAQLAERIRGAGKPVATIAFGDPYGPARLATAGSYMLAWQPRGEHAQIAAARALSGVAGIAGILPVELPHAPRGSGLRRARVGYTLSAAEPESVGINGAALARVDSIIEAALADHASPGAALAIGRHGRLVRLRGYGKVDYRTGFGAVTDSSLYDLASLTKVVGTTTAAMMLVQDSLLDLDAPVKQYLPEWAGSPAKDSVTIRHLLTHSAGLPPFRPFWRDARGRQEFLDRIAALPLDYAPGTRMVYSDIGLITIGLVVERITGQTLDRFLASRLFEPLHMREMRFNPGADRELLPRIAPTERDTVFRKEHVHGRVHDENAFAMGGVAGHAGLFSSARDLAAFAQMLLNRGFHGDRRILSSAVIDTFRRRQNSLSTRALGWDTPGACGLGTAAGDYFSAASIGHTGFTGTSLWIDFDRDLFVVLLTNRVNPTRENQKHVALRRAVHDVVQLALRDPNVTVRVDSDRACR